MQLHIPAIETTHLNAARKLQDLRSTMLFACKADFAAHGIESLAALTRPTGQDCYICMQSMDEQYPFSNGVYDGSSDMDAGTNTDIAMDTSTTRPAPNGCGSSGSSVNTYHGASSHEIIRVKAYRHIYHKACLFAWLATGTNYPQCRRQLFDPAGNKPIKAAMLRVLRRLMPRLGVDDVIESDEKAIIKECEEKTRVREMIGAEIGVDFWENDLTEVEDESEEEAENSVTRDDYESSGGLFGDDEDEGMIADDEDEGV